MRYLLPPRSRGLTAQSRWASIAAVVLVVGGGLLSGWNIGFAGYSTFYSTAARSMSLSWRALAFGAFDPRASVTLDKLAGFLVPQAASAAVFGFHPWSIALPQVIEAMVTVAATYLIGLRWRGGAAGLIAAAATASTPLLASMFGHVMEDGLLTMSLALSALCLQSALIRGRLLPLFGSAFWVAIGFQAKMMQAWIVLPALAVGYLLAGPGPARRRLRFGGLAGVVAVGLSVVWMTAIQLSPAADRPYIDGSTNNNVYSMVFGYNGFNRVIPNLIPGAIGDRAHPHGVSHPSGGASARSDRISRRGSRFRTMTRTVTHQRPQGAWPGNRRAKLLLPYFDTQVGWLYPLAAAGLALELWPLLRRPLLRRRLLRRPLFRRPVVRVLPTAGPARIRLATGALVSGWLLGAAGLLTVAQVPHAAYLSAISVQVALLSAAALVRAVRLYRLPGLRTQLVLPVLLVAEAGWTAVVLRGSGVAPRFLLPAVLVAGLGTAAGLVLAAVRHRLPRSRVVLAAAVAAVLLAPVVWSGFVLDRHQDGSAGEAYAGPHRPAWAEPGPATSTRAAALDVTKPFLRPPDPRLTPGQDRLLHYLRAHHGQHRLLMATDQWQTASPYILDSGADVMTMGGWSGLAPTPTLRQARSLVADGTLRYVLITESRPRGRNNPDVGQVLSWLHQVCSPIPDRAFGGPSPSLVGLRLYACGTALDD